MARNLNKCCFIGNVGKQPESRFTPAGVAVTSLSLAVGDDYKDKQGNKVEQTDWIPVTFFGRQAEIVNEWVKSGSKLYIEGKFKTEKYQSKDGTDRYSTKIHATYMEMLGSANGTNPSAQGSSSGHAGGQHSQSGEPNMDDWDSEIPF